MNNEHKSDKQAGANTIFSPEKPFTPPRWVAVLVLVLALVYGAIPVDFVPEAVLGPIGTVDDLGVLGVALVLLLKAFRNRKTE